MSKNLKDFKLAHLSCLCSGWSYNLWDDKLGQQILISCMKQPKTIEKITDEICIAPAYFENHIKNVLVENKLLKVTQDGKYLTDFIIYPAQEMYDFEYEISELYSNLQTPVTDRLYKIKDKICGVGFFGNDFDFEYLLWILYIFVQHSVIGLMYKKNRSKWEGKVPAGNGKKYRLMGTVTFPGENINMRGELKRNGYSNIHSGYKTPNNGKVILANLYDYEPFPRTRHEWINEKNIPLLMKLFDDPGYKLDEYEREYAANFISQDILKNKNGKLYLNMPVFTEAQQNEIKKIISAELEDIAEEYAEKAAEICDRILLPITREDMLEEYVNWIMSNAFDILPYLFYENKYLQIPEDYNASAAGLCLYIE